MEAGPYPRIPFLKTAASSFLASTDSSSCSVEVDELSSGTSVTSLGSSIGWGRSKGGTSSSSSSSEFVEISES